MCHGHLDNFQKTPLGGRPHTKTLGDHGTPNTHNRWFILFYHVWGPKWIEIHWNSIWLRVQSHMTSHYTWGFVTSHYMTLEVSWDGLWTLSFGLPQLHGHGSWLVHEVAPRRKHPQDKCSKFVNHYRILIVNLIGEAHTTVPIRKRNFTLIMV
jgi:hypothetical protein